MRFDHKKLEACPPPKKLGSHWNGHGVEFSLFSQHAHQVELCLFDQSGQGLIGTYELALEDEGMFYGYFPELEPGYCYGYRVYGPYSPKNGHRFNPNKLLIDPYATQLKGHIIHDPSLYDYELTDEILSKNRFDPEILVALKPSLLDSASFMPKAIISSEQAYPFQAQQPELPWEKTVIYEAHVKGFSMLANVPYAGTYQALKNPRLIDHLLKLGVNAIELLPIQSFIHDERLVKLGLKNYWGYQPIQFFCPMNDYFYQQQLNELKASIDRLHQHGIEVILDVVYNHTGEGDHLGPTLSFRGIDQKLYYEAHEQEAGFLRDTSGCGNRLKLAEPMVLRLLLDSLRYWVSEFKIDGFRFDLCTSLGRSQGGFDPQSAFFQAIAQDPILNRVKLIAEPWDLGENGYQLGHFPRHWHEWNDQFRDRSRQFWRGDLWQKHELANVICGSSAQFKKNHPQKTTSINYICSHDGFCLRDLVSYEQKHNESNLENNQDGHNENYSCHYGVEGESDDPLIKEKRIRHQKNLWATLCLSRGTPMILAGDEMLKTQQGNNNAYCQDQALSYLPWHQQETVEGQAWFEFCALMLQWRKQQPLIYSQDWLWGKACRGFGERDLSWLNADGSELKHDDWYQAEAQELIFKRADQEQILLVALNPSLVDRKIAVDPYHRWHLILDSSESLTHNIQSLKHKPLIGQQIDTFHLKAQSLVILEAKIQR
jgi:isoamylase